MLLGMLKWQKRVLPFTVLVALFFLMGHAMAAPGTGSEATKAAAEQGAVAPPDDSALAAPSNAPVVDAQTNYMDTDPAAVTLWRPELEPYGVWYEDPAYGLVWIPDPDAVGADFVPYSSGGHWGYTAEGDWLWVSDYEWGWVAFHYGRWVWIPERGWAWIPGRMYAPAWVVWRVGEPGYGYVGWAPMPPTYYWYGGVAVSLWVVPPPYYVYCESHYVFDHHVHHHRLHGHHARGAANHTRPYRPGGPSSSRGRYAARPSRGPSLNEARVPASAVPRTPAQPHPRAAAAATPTSGSRTSGATAVRPATRPSSRIAGVSQPVYSGRPSRAVAADRRAAPLASRSNLRAPSAGTTARPRGGQTLGSSSTPSRTAPGRTGRWGGQSGAAPAPRPAPRPSASPSAPGHGRPTTTPGRRSSSPSRPSYGNSSSRPSYSAPSRPSRPSRPSYGSSSSRPSYGSSTSRPTYRAPSRPSGGSGYGNNNNNNNKNNKGRKSRGRGKSRRR
jgi:Family of unknown function (DUF6600)